jgi:hypothetical protein
MIEPDYDYALPILAGLADAERTDEDLPGNPIRTASQVLTDGRAKHGDAWKGRSVDYYVDHARAHLEILGTSDAETEDHLAHAATDLLLAIELRRRIQELEAAAGGSPNVEALKLAAVAPSTTDSEAPEEARP